MKNNYTLGINTGFAVNRYAEHSVWTDIVGNELGLEVVQFTADMLNVDLPNKIIFNKYFYAKPLTTKTIYMWCRHFREIRGHLFTTVCLPINIPKPNTVVHCPKCYSFSTVCHKWI